MDPTQTPALYQDGIPPLPQGQPVDVAASGTAQPSPNPTPTNSGPQNASLLSPNAPANSGEGVAPGVFPAPVPFPVQQGVGYSTDSPKIADDVDLIEKEWVLKAKEIVAKTRDDPNKQSADMNRFKADYLKTRYSKDIKVSET